MLEMAILLPFLAFLFLVALDFCRAFYTTQTVQNCASAAALYASGTARVASGTTTEQAAKQAAVAEGTLLNPPLSADNVAVSMDGNRATVTVTYNFSLITGFPGFSRTLPVVRSVTMQRLPRAGE
jgi:Flp pilus assembly protein TadG